MTSSVGDRLSQGYRVIRQLTGVNDSPWQGALVCGPDGEMVVLIDAATLGDEWGGWAAAANGHVLAPLDILLRPGGHDVMLPVCTERIEEFLVRRVAAGADLSPGEGVTVAVSLLRGLAELHSPSARHEAVADVRGSWWLTDAGRPVFATGTADTPVVEATVELLRLVARDVADLAAALADVTDALTEPRPLMRELERAEAELFAVAGPLALATTTFGPRRVRDSSIAAGENLLGDDEPSRPWPLSLVRHLDADWADLVSRTTTGVWRRLRTRAPGGRRRPWLVAGGLAGVLVVGGLLWPTAPGGPATADVPPQASSAEPSPSPAPAPTPAPEPRSTGSDLPGADSAAPPASEGHDDLASVAAALLTARSECAQEPTCLEAIVETRDAQFPAGVVDLPPAERSVILLDEFGGAAVIRVESAGSPPQLVVLVRADGRWLIRDVHDVAGQ